MKNTESEISITMVSPSIDTIIEHLKLFLVLSGFVRRTASRDKKRAAKTLYLSRLKSLSVRIFGNRRGIIPEMQVYNLTAMPPATSSHLIESALQTRRIYATGY